MVILLLLLLDGSSIVLKTENVKFDFHTKFGALVVPAEEVINISLGVRLEGDPAQYERMVKALGSDNYREREEATKFLKANRRGAYKFLINRPKEDSVELGKRVEILLNQYITVPQAEDRVVFPTGSLTGFVKQEFIEGESDSLGKVKVRMSQVVSIGIKKVDGKVVLTQKDGWKAIGYVGGRFKIAVTGSVDMFPQNAGQYMASPDGPATGLVHEGFPQGAALGRVGQTIFLVGSHLEMDNMAHGLLEMRINGASWTAPFEGQYEVYLNGKD